MSGSYAGSSGSAQSNRGMDYPPPAGPPARYHREPTPNLRPDIPQSRYAEPGGSETYAPPPGPPPGKGGSITTHDPEQHAPVHDWTIIPDTALLPPPPALTNDYSPTANAPEVEGDAAYQWGLKNPLWQPRPLPPAQLRAMRAYAHTLVMPQGFTGDVQPRTSDATPGAWHIRSRPGTRDSCLQTSLPLFSALNDSPNLSERSKTAYFELKLLSYGDTSSRARRRPPASLEEAEAGVAIGFFAPPYLGWRLPGWQRGSLAVHGDDGRRYVNNPFGGVDFTTAFNAGETVGIGMTWRPQLSDAPPTYGDSRQSPLAVDVFFTRDGQKAGGWNLHEEMDSERMEGGTVGLDGEHDIFAVVGIFGAVEVDVSFNPRDWRFRPEGT